MSTIDPTVAPPQSGPDAPVPPTPEPPAEPTVRMDGELAGRLLASSRWLQ